MEGGELFFSICHGSLFLFLIYLQGLDNYLMKQMHLLMHLSKENFVLYMNYKLSILKLIVSVPFVVSYLLKFKT